MKTVSFLHQKGGTGKSTLAISAAMALSARGQRVVLMDADYQGTSSEWGNRFGMELGVETRSQVQPIVHEEKHRFEKTTQWLLIDGPPTLTSMTESILRASDRVLIPCRPSRPDVWAMPWLAAIIQKMGKQGGRLDAQVLFNMVRQEDLEPLRAEVERMGLQACAESVPAEEAFVAVFDGKPLPAKWQDLMWKLVGGEEA